MVPHVSEQMSHNQKVFPAPARALPDKDQIRDWEMRLRFLTSKRKAAPEPVLASPFPHGRWQPQPAVRRESRELEPAKH
jgi:hypothetical protein